MRESVRAPGISQHIEIRRSALVHNIRQFRGLIGPRRKLLAVVKANAYGHGLRPVAEIAVASGVDWLGVHSLEEAVALDEARLRVPILILGYVPLESLDEVVRRGLRLVVYNRRTIGRLGSAAKRLGKKALVHIKLETGTNRQGVSPDDFMSFVDSLRKHEEISVEGISSHFANIEDTTQHDYPRYQLEVFRRANEILSRQGIRIPIRHIACTAATILFPETYFDMARVGIGLYGLWPSKETYLSRLMQRKPPLSLRPVLSWKALIAQVKEIPADSFISYGCTFKTTRKTKLAVVPVGYYDGYNRALSNSSHILVHGRRAPVRGRVAMDFLMADVTDIPGVRLEDEATLIGKDGKEEVTAEDLAAITGTISYEIVSRINPLIPRIVV